MKKLSIILLFVAVYGHAQYVPIVSQYMFNDISLNPANTGNKNALSVFGGLRAQWVGIPGAPRTQSFAAHSPLRDKSSAVGIQFFSDKIGVDQVSGIYGSYAYRIKMKEMQLSFGLAAGINLVKSSNSSLNVHDQGDDLLSDPPLGVLPDVSFGAVLNAKKYFVSFSIPFFLSHVQESNGYVVDHNFKNYNFMLGGGYQLVLKNEMKFTPSLLLKYKPGGRPQADINMMFGIHPIVDVGVSYRTEESIIVLTKVKPTSQLSIMYSFGMPITPISYKQYGSHELGIQYNFIFKSKSINPRYLSW